MTNKFKDLLTLLGEKLAPGASDVVVFVKRARDDWYWKQVYHDYRMRLLIRAQRLDFQEHIDRGADLATAKFVIRCSGQIQDERGIWIKKSRDLPASYIKSFKLIAIDASNTRLTAEGTDNFADLHHLRSLILRNCKYLDDFACDQIARQFRKSRTLESIDLSLNDQISVNGLNVLFRIPSLREIRAFNTAATRFQEIDLFTLAAEEERNCKVLVHEDGRQFLSDELEDLRLDKQTLLLTDEK